MNHAYGFTYVKPLLAPPFGPDPKALPHKPITPHVKAQPQRGCPHKPPKMPHKTSELPWFDKELPMKWPKTVRKSPKAFENAHIALLMPADLTHDPTFLTDFTQKPLNLLQNGLKTAKNS